MMAKGTATASATCLQINHAASQKKNTRVEQPEEKGEEKQRMWM